jgi:TolB-like protein
LGIEIPKGGYRAFFSERMPSAEPSVASAQIPESAVQASPPRARGWRRPGALAWSLILASALAGVFGWIAILHRIRQTNAPSQTNTVIRLAVMPISNETGDAAKSYISDGLTDNLIRQLSELPRLRVMARTAVDRVKPADVARALGVTMVLSSSLVRNADGRLMLNSELSNVADGTVLSSRQHLADESDLPSLQADVVQDVIRTLGIELDARQSADGRPSSNTNAAAFQAFLRGESAARNPGPQGLHAAIRYYEKAIREDGRFALAYASLAETHAMLGLYYEPAREQMPLAQQYAERALMLDPHMGRAHGTLGLIHLVYGWNLRQAENELASAETRLSAIHTLSCTSHLYHFMGSEHIRHADEDVRRLLEFDPHSASLIAELGCVSYYEADTAIRFAITGMPWQRIRGLLSFTGAEAVRSRWKDDTARLWRCCGNSKL